MSDRPRPASVRRGPAPSTPPPDPGMRTVTFLFGSSLGDVSVSLPRHEAELVRADVGRAWNSPDGRMFTIEGDAGLTLVNLSRVIAVTVR